MKTWWERHGQKLDGFLDRTVDVFVAGALMLVGTAAIMMIVLAVMS